ncbi:restriction endonuclease subunit S [Bifidobacterium olomucense]|uniref:Type I restriction-modification system, subunit S n=1 Tax=Bifidobacterium olomucense TaxID=2675324 RepID=A0A7Y0EWQ9_9BIFI|nr:restriction endonuclease subunit S [Bifidobacterium sp. DSM 109959]NMM97836.1 type I restriction-modification system, subunit S [Bifidobacterium sp. DSM 109959]
MGCELSELISLVRGNTYKSKLLGDDGPALLGLGTIARNGGFNGSKLRHYPGETSEKILMHPNDLYVSLKDITNKGDLLGAVARVPSKVSLGRLTQDTVALRFREGVSVDYQHYVYWLLRTPQYRDYCRARGMGTTNLSLSRDVFLAWKLPDFSSARRLLVETLEAIEELIDNLNQTNGHLFELLKIEFAHRFENGDTPVSDLGSVVSIWKKSVKPASNPDKYWEHYSIPAFDAEQYPSFELGNTIKSNKYEVVPNSILVSKLNPTTRRLWLPQLINTDNAICSTEFIEYVPNNQKNYSFYCSALMQDRFFSYLEGHVTGSTGSRQRVHPSDTLAYTVPNPSASEIRDYCMFADPVIEQIRNTSIESKRLATLRDALLPKLMSGEIDVSKVELPTRPEQTVPANGRLPERDS